jgi:hypothetical protein
MRGRRIIALTLGDDGVASSRVRVSSVLTHLRSDGWDVVRVSADHPLWPAALLFKLLAKRPAVTLVQKVVPPGWFARLVSLLSQKLVYECDDAIHLGHGDRDLAISNSRRLRTLLPLSDSVIVSNVLLKDDLIQLGAREPVVFPGPAPEVLSLGDGGRRGVLWLGSPSTFENVRSLVYPAIEQLPASFELLVVGAAQNAHRGRVTEQVWTLDRQSAALVRCRVGVAPQPIDEWSLRKAFYKVLEYLAADIVPVVPDQPAVAYLLGEELETVAVVASNDSPEAWAEAIRHASNVTVDDKWRTARERIFARWSSERLGQVVTE